MGADVDDTLIDGPEERREHVVRRDAAPYVVRDAVCAAIVPERRPCGRDILDHGAVDERDWVARLEFGSEERVAHVRDDINFLKRRGVDDETRVIQGRATRNALASGVQEEPERPFEFRVHRKKKLKDDAPHRF